MTVKWNERQPQVLKQAFLMVNVAEAMVILAIMLALRSAARNRELVLPEPAMPVRSIPYSFFPQPPPIVADRPVLPFPNDVALPADPVGPPLPVPDKLADVPTMPTQGELGVLLGRAPNLKLNEPGVKFVPDTMNLAPVPEPEKPSIPKPDDFVRTTRKPEAILLEVPVYPENCRLLGIGGTATIQMLLDLNGSVTATRVGRTSGSAQLDSAAVNAARKSRFTPALGAHQKPVHVWVAVPFEFRVGP